MNEKNDEVKNLLEYLKQYSFDDLAKSFFVLNLWLPNVSSPIKIQYLYVILESIYAQLQKESRITSYDNFKTFCESLINLIPSFSMLEDYVPQPDWKDVKFYLGKKSYYIFYGGDLSNPYDFYYAYEIIHKTFESEYSELINKTPSEELRFCLSAQDHILKTLEQEKIDIEQIIHGDLKIPDKKFWLAGVTFIDNHNPLNYLDAYTLNFYKTELTQTSSVPSMDMFVDNAFRGRNSRYFFIHKDNKFYPVMPRRWVAVMYDRWGNLLKENYELIKDKLGEREPEALMGQSLSNFISDRLGDDHVFSLATAITDTLKPYKFIFTAIHSKDNLYLIHVTPPAFENANLSNYLKKIEPKLEESYKLLTQTPTRLGLLAKKQILEFRSKEGKALKPIYLIIIPSPRTDSEGAIEVPKKIDAEIMTLDQITGIFDELEKAEELGLFIEYLREERKLNRMNGLNSYLDKFGAYKDSSGVLVRGALEPNMIMLDFSLGSNFRFRNLKDFWDSFPDQIFYGHPRSWAIPEKRKTKTGLILQAKSFFGYAYYQKIGNASVFINAPVHLMGIEIGKVTDSIMHGLFDAIDIYPEILKHLEFSKTAKKIQVIFFPSSLVAINDDLKHVRQLMQDVNLWAMDYTRLGINDYGVRVVYNDLNLMHALGEVKDRSIQVSLLIDVLDQLSKHISEPDFQNIKSKLEAEKNKKARFKFFAVQKKFSFPEGVGVILPEDREYKIADKEISKLAHELGIEPGEYTSVEAKEKLNKLRSKMVEHLNLKVARFNFANNLPILIERLNALIYDSWRNEEGIKASIDHEVDYERGEHSAEKEKKLLHWHRVHRYVIEKFTQLKPNGSIELNDSELKELLAVSDRLIDIYSDSDFINYGLYPVNVKIDSDYVVSTFDQENDIAKMERGYGEEQAKLRLGIIGNDNDTADARLEVTQYLDDLDSAFKIDFGFGLKNLVNVQQIMALWSGYSGKEEDTYYSATADEILKICSQSIRGFYATEIEPILDFLTLKSEELLRIKGESILAQDLPVWEHHKRLMRYDLRPLIKLEEKYYWGAPHIERVSNIWLGISSKHKLPSDLYAPNVKVLLEKGHKDLEDSLVKKIEEIVLRFTDKVKTDVFPHDFDKTINDIGDFDVLGFLEQKNILLNIESKIIDPPHSHKDAGRMQRTFFGETKEDGSFKKGYVQKVEEREEYLKKQYATVMNKMGWKVSTSQPKVISILVTKMGFWWTKNPPIDTTVEFVETRLLEDYVKQL